MRLEQTIRESILSESMDLDGRLQQLVRAGLMPSNTLPLLRRAISKIQSGMTLQGPERDVLATFINSMMFIVLGDDAIFNRARVGAKGYATEEVERIDEISKGTAMKALQYAASDPDSGRSYTLQKKISKKWPGMKDHAADAAHVAMYGRSKNPGAAFTRDKLADRAKTSYRMTKDGKANKQDLRARFRKEEAEQIDELSPSTMTNYLRATSRTAKSPKDSDKRKRGAMMAVKKLSKEEAEQIDELSQDKLMAYRSAARKQGSGVDKGPRQSGYNLAGRKVNPGLSAAQNKAPRVAATEETQIDELSKKTLGSYVKKAAGHAAGSAAASAAIASSSNPKVPTKVKRDLRNRMVGISKATDKLTKEDIDAVKKMNESYKTAFDTALIEYGIKSPSELDESKRKEFFNYVDQEFKKGDN